MARCDLEHVENRNIHQTPFLQACLYKIREVKLIMAAIAKIHLAISNLAFFDGIDGIGMWTRWPISTSNCDDALARSQSAQ